MKDLILGVIIGVLVTAAIACTTSLVDFDGYNEYRDSIQTRSRIDTTQIDTTATDTVKINVSDFKEEIGGEVTFGINQ